jgi:hypothetical protein
LLLDAGGPAANFVIDRGGGPGLIHYQLCYAIRVPEGFRTTTKTIQSLEYWVIGPDGSLYDNKVHGSLVGEKLGGVSSTVGIGCRSTIFDDRDLNRPTAATYRVSLEYTFDSGSPAGRHVVTAERPIASNAPARPLMTSLNMTSDVPGQPPIRRDNRPMTFIAAGGGGTPPYQYQWRYGNNVVLRDWGPDPKFVWDGSVPGATSVPGSADVTVLARGAGGSEAEVMKIMSVFLR